MKKLTILVMAVAVVSVLASPAQAARKFHVSMSVARTVTQHTNVYITGRVSPNAAGQKIVIQKRFLSGSNRSWQTERKVRVRADGTYSYSYKVTTMKPRLFRAYKPKRGTTRAGYSKARKVVVKKAVQRPASLTITSTGPTTLDAGQNFVLNGSASANLIGQWIQLQVLDGGTWSKIGGGRVRADGGFTASGVATQAGAGRQVRAYAGPTAGSQAAASGARSFTVYGWYYLSITDQVDDDSWYWTDGSYQSQNINGVTYPLTSYQYSGGDNAWAEWNLQRRCTTFAAVVGLLDSSPTGSRQNAAVSADSVGLWSRTNIGLGQSYPVTLNITSYLRLRLTAAYVAGDGQLGFGDARIRCAF